MIEILSGTDRPGSRTLQIAKLMQSYFQDEKLASHILDLASLPLHRLHGAGYNQGRINELADAVDLINSSSGVVFIIPEYNGSFPGALKHFIDYWKFPDSMESRPMAFIGLGGRFGGLRAVEQMQQVMSYRNAYIFPQRVFLLNIQNTLKDGQLADSAVVDLMKTQVRDFSRFVKALEGAGLDANSRISTARR